jgi:hypothetical protein
MFCHDRLGIQLLRQVPQIYYGKWFFQIYFIRHNNYLKPICELSEAPNRLKKKVPQYITNTQFRINLNSVKNP